MEEVPRGYLTVGAIAHIAHTELAPMAAVATSYTVVIINLSLCLTYSCVTCIDSRLSIDLDISSRTVIRTELFLSCLMCRFRFLSVAVC